jgi:hypothetical protein
MHRATSIPFELRKWLINSSIGQNHSVDSMIASSSHHRRQTRQKLATRTDMWLRNAQSPGPNSSAPRAVRYTSASVEVPEAIANASFALPRALRAPVLSESVQSVNRQRDTQRSAPLIASQKASVAIDRCDSMMGTTTAIDTGASASPITFSSERCSTGGAVGGTCFPCRHGQ